MTAVSKRSCQTVQLVMLFVSCQWVFTTLNNKIKHQIVFKSFFWRLNRLTEIEQRVREGQNEGGDCGVSKKRNGHQLWYEREMYKRREGEKSNTCQLKKEAGMERKVDYCSIIFLLQPPPLYFQILSPGLTQTNILTHWAIYEWCLVIGLSSLNFQFKKYSNSDFYLNISGAQDWPLRNSTG